MTKTSLSYRKKHHRDGEGDSGQYGHANDQQEDIRLVHLGVGVQKLGLHVRCIETQQKAFSPEAHPAPKHNMFSSG